MAEHIKVNYEQLDDVANRFTQQSQNIQQMQQQIRAGMDRLIPDGWLGKGADSFTNEMQGEILPAIQRFFDALEEAGRVTREIGETMKQAEEEARSLFMSS